MITWQDDMNKLPDDNEGRCKCIFDIIHPSYGNRLCNTGGRKSSS